MNGNTPVHNDDGSTVTLRHYIERVLEEREKAVALAYQAMNQRIERLNELRDEVQKDRGQFLRMDVYDEKHEALEKSVHELERTLTATLGENSRRLHQRIDALESWRLKAVGVFLVLVPLSGLIGAAIMRAFT